eukprot:m.232337 g.232337  ORF g.232337 m.232337 type:complete len:811 (-) comp15713_c0_seq4:140-2572(-)
MPWLGMVGGVVAAAAVVLEPVSVTLRSSLIELQVDTFKRDGGRRSPPNRGPSPSPQRSPQPPSTIVSSLTFSQEAATQGFGFVSSGIENAQHQESATAIWADGEGYLPAGGGHLAALAADGSSVRVENVTLGTVATETWNLSVSGAVLSWTVSRTFARNTTVTDDWLAGFGMNPFKVTNSAERSTQMPGWMDLDALLDFDSPNRAGFKQVYSVSEPPRYNMESRAFTPNSTSRLPRISWSPSGMEFATIELSCARSSGALCTPKFVWSRSVPGPKGASRSATCDKKTPAPGLPEIDCRQYKVVCPNGDQVNGGPGLLKIGVSASVRGAPAAFVAGETLVATWSVQLEPTTAERAAAPLLLSIPGDPELAAQSTQLARQFTEPVAGWWAASNSPASVTCLHELSWFPMAWSVLGRDGNRTLDALFARQLEYYGTVSLDQSPAGYIQGRWDISCPENFTAFGESNPNFILSAYYHAVNTGDKQYISALWPVLTRVGEYITGEHGMNMSVHGVPYTPHTTARAGEWVPANWYDEVNFGAFDSIVAVYAVQSIEAMAQLATWLDRPAPEAAAYSALAARARTAYNTVFWDDASGWYGEWRDVDGKLRSTGYLWPQFVAMSELANVSSVTQRTRTLDAIDSNFARIRKQFGVTEQGQWCTPDNLLPLAESDCHWSSDCSRWPEYEMGLCFLWLTGWEAYARARYGDPDRAYELYAKLLGGRQSGYSRFKTTRFWQQGNGWGPHESREQGQGSDVLMDQIVALWGFLRGAFGIEPTLAGLKVVHRPAAQLEGASWTFTHLGRQRTATVVNGTVRLD